MRHGTTEDIKLAVRLAIEVLQEPDPFKKAELTEKHFKTIEKWRTEGGAGEAEEKTPDAEPLSAVPDKPRRSDLVNIVESRRMKSLGKGGSLKSRMAIVHSLAHIESWMPLEFIFDFSTVAMDEARHFKLLVSRLEAMGGKLGDFDAHDGLWESAHATRECLPSRLAIEHCVHEARGLDILPQTIARFASNGDKETAKVLSEVVYPEEITHCAAGLKWFCYLAVRDDGEATGETREACMEEIGDLRLSCGEPADGTQSKSVATVHETLGAHSVEVDRVVESFHRVVREHFKGRLKRPFNTEARSLAGFTEAWYEPLAQ